MRGKVLFITVGTSALSAKLLGRLAREKFARFEEDRWKYLDAPDIKKHMEPNLLKDALAAHRLVWEVVAQDDRRGGAVPSGRPIMERVKHTSAEMTSTYLLTRTRAAALPGRFAAGTDRFVLLASATRDGQLCARINAQLIHDYLFQGGCNCGADATAEPGCRWVQVRTIEEMKARAFGANVSRSVAQILDDCAKDRESYCNITGGFKGAVPAITCWCVHNARDAFYQHESSHETVRLIFRPSQVEPDEEVYDPLPAPTS